MNVVTPAPQAPRMGRSGTVSPLPAEARRHG